MVDSNAASVSELAVLARNLGTPSILVVGDLMLDRYVWGDAARISQEAPVILLQADRREERLGGASSVATLLAALGAKVDLCGVTGDDDQAPRVRSILDKLGIRHESVIADSSRPTTVKERYIGRAQHRHPQQMIRVDYEEKSPVNKGIESRLIEAAIARLDGTGCVLISDYDKGVCTPGLLAPLIKEARRRGIAVLADPTRGGDWTKYKGSSSLTPNRLEAGLAVGRTLETTEEAFRAASEIMRAYELDAGIVTLDRDGMALVRRDGRAHLFPTRPRQVYDITGAGDMVMAVLGMVLATGADFAPAIQLANVAGGLEVEKIGVAPVTIEEILADLQVGASAANQHKEGPKSKVVGPDELESRSSEARRLGQKIVFTNGCFDLLHAGHVAYLAEARRQGDLLVVGLNSDESVRSLKGPSRPVHNEGARGVVLAALEAVDLVCVFGEATPLELIQRVRPDVLVKGADYRRETVVGGDFVESYGGRVHLARLEAGLSTSLALEKLRAA
jgi:D-beta-D-heptose 7-phosphate kinase/D-beta-D-heptose 1-phosphate adenosyltransferase